MALKVWSAVAAIVAILLATVIAIGAEHGGQPRLEIISGAPDASPAYTDFAYHLRTNLHTWWQRAGHREVPPLQRWQVEISQIGMRPQTGVAVWVRRPPAIRGAEWVTAQVFRMYPLAGQLVEPSAVLAAAAAIEFLLVQTGTGITEEQKR